MFWEWLNQLGKIIAVFVVVWSCLKTLHAQPNQGLLGFFRVWLQQVAYYARYFMLWVMAWAGLNMLLPDTERLYYVMFGLACVYIYASWIVPNRLVVKHAAISLNSSNTSPDTPHMLPLKIAVLSDIHVGIFSGKPKQIKHIVKTLNALEVDAVLIAGDWLYYAGADIIGQLLPFKALNKPCYTVFSEQDETQIAQQADPQNQLITALNVLDIQIINDAEIDLGTVLLIGVGNGLTNPATLTPRVFSPTVTAFASEKPLLILTHDIKQIQANANNLLELGNKKLIITGQTHGGQVNIPFLTPAIVQAMTGTHGKSGLQTIRQNARSHYLVWTTTGIGMTGLPFRLNCPPTIDVLTLR